MHACKHTLTLTHTHTHTHTTVHANKPNILMNKNKINIPTNQKLYKYILSNKNK